MESMKVGLAFKTPDEKQATQEGMAKDQQEFMYRDANRNIKCTDKSGANTGSQNQKPTVHKQEDMGEENIWIPQDTWR